MLWLELAYQNANNTLQRDVVVHVDLPSEIHLVSDTTYLFNSNYPKGIDLQTEDLPKSGFSIGDYGPTANAFVDFAIAIPFADHLKCGRNETEVVGSAHPRDLNEVRASVHLGVDKEC
jgi:hypothetical protein